MKKTKGLLNKVKERMNDYLYACEFIKECDKATVQCKHGGNSYCGEYKKRLKKEKKQIQQKQIPN